MLPSDNVGNIPPSQPFELGGFQTRRKGLDDTLRCIGCILSRTEEGATIDMPTIETCTGLDTSAVNPLLRGMEDANLLETFTPDKIVRPLGGKWLVKATRYLRPTELGSALLPVRAQPECRIQKPFVRLTPLEERVIRCIRCVLSKSENIEGPVANGVLSDQIVECQDAVPRSVNQILNTLVDGKLLEKRPVSRLVWGKGKGPLLYTPTPEGSIWLRPDPDESCPGPNFEVPLPKGQSIEQQKVLGCIACLHGSPNATGTLDPIRLITITKCQGLQTSTASTVIRKLLANGYLKAEPRPGTRKTDHYLPTESGEQLLGSIQMTDGCPSRKIIKQRRDLRAVVINDKEIRDLATRTAVSIIKELPTASFRNGAELLRHLDTTSYEGTTYLELLMRAITSSVRRQMRGDGSDVAQEVLVSLAKRDTEITFPDPGLQTVFGIASHKVIDNFRKLKRESPDSLDMLEHSQPEGSQSHHFESNLASQMDARHIFEELIRDIKLSPLEKAILGTMAFGSGTTGTSTDAQELATQFNTTANNVRVIKFRLLARLREHKELRTKWEEA